jgi:opacity protein-like surface antigen
MRRAKLKITTSVLLFFVLALALSADVPLKKMTLGFYGGWTFGSGDAFEWQYRGRTSELYRFNYHLGTYVQFNLSKSFGLQVNGNYQNGSLRSEWYNTLPGEKYQEVTRFGIFSLSLNGVYTMTHGKRLQLFLLGGSGFSTGKWQDFEGVYFNLNVGFGVKVFVSKSRSFPVLLFMGTFTYLFDPDDGYTPTAGFLKLSLGFAF